MAINYVLARVGEDGAAFGVDGTAAAITAAAENATIAGDPTALGLVNAITTANPVSDVVIKYDASVVTSANALVVVLDNAVRFIRSSGKAG